LVLSGYFLNSALKASGGDPLCLHELGVLAFQKKEYTQAIQWFHRALSALTRLEAIRECIERCHDPYWEPTVFNLGHAFRKTRQFDLALVCFQRCVALCPAKFSAYSALGFTKHLVDDSDGAIVCYHQALSCKPDDPFSTEMLNRALRETLSKGALLDDILGSSQSTEPFFRSWSMAKDESAVDEAMDESDDTMMSP
jgi:anaphase-promoting complex subunit 6